MSIKSRGFTLVEVLVIAPVVILFIGVFIGLLVNLTGESLMVREKNSAAYDTQASLDTIETSIAQATAFLTTTGTLPIPQGKEDYSTTAPSTTAFSNVNVNGFDALIIESVTTDKNTTDPARSLIYTGTGACDSKNPLYTYMTIYFVAADPDTADTADKALYKRTVVPQTPACATPWQRNSCNPIHKSTYSSTCKANDEKLASGISVFDVKYFVGSNTTEAGDVNARSATDVSVDLSLAKQAAGSSFTQSGSTRTNSINVQSADSTSGSGGGPTIPPTNPPIENSRNADGPNPYQTTFTWGRVNSASSYKFRYNFNGGAWTEVTVNNPWWDANLRPSYVVEGTSRKQAVNVEVDVVSNVGTYRYGTGSATATPTWNSCALLNGWTNYGGAYANAGFTRTSAGVIGLRGLIRWGTASSTIAVCTLPVGFRPAQNLIFQTYTSAGAARIDVYTDGSVMVTSANTGWVTLSGITFLAAGAATSTAWSDGLWQNGWVNYSAAGNAWGNFKYATDTLGRVHVEGLGRAGTLTSGTLLSASLGAASLKPSHFLHLISSAGGGNSALSLNGTGSLLARGVAGSGYQSVAFSYYPSVFTSWNTIPMTNGWVNYNTATYPPAQCYKASDDLVMIRGLVKTGANGVSSSSLNGIGCGIHADGRLIMGSWMNVNSPARIDILADGTINMTVSDPGWTSLDNLRFIAD